METGLTVDQVCLRPLSSILRCPTDVRSVMLRVFVLFPRFQIRLDAEVDGFLASFNLKSDGGLETIHGVRFDSSRLPGQL